MISLFAQGLVLDDDARKVTNDTARTLSGSASPDKIGPHGSLPGGVFRGADAEQGALGHGFGGFPRVCEVGLDCLKGLVPCYDGCIKNRRSGASLGTLRARLKSRGYWCIWDSSRNVDRHGTAPYLTPGVVPQQHKRI